jgi:hypothetical protein
VLIFVSGPYSAATDAEIGANIGRACAAGKAVIDRGHWPLIPHCNVVYDLWHIDEHEQAPEYEFYLRWDAELLRRCDALLYVASSPGADRELALARELSLPVYLSVDGIPAGALGRA